MKNTSLLLPILLIGCSAQQFTPDQDALLSNPLYAETYAESMVDTMVNLEIYNDPILEDTTVKALADSTKETWLKVAKAARAAQGEGQRGTFVPMQQYVEGEVLYRENMVHFSTFFNTVPGPSLHVFLTTVVDPRDSAFPDTTALDIGVMTVPYGAQSFPVPEVENPFTYRTVALWDTELKRLYGFAQISKPF
ncbi:MAG: DM13 domain-containing protein [Candidatus Peregrinibacteria bacterium]|nr:DM13 domain-containing protein [Candidatus Peregrinibacteria bacterium]MCB9808228.1 DM13 domain-containing protein [Candidatus Peribacteria bacterium]